MTVETKPKPSPVATRDRLLERGKELLARDGWSRDRLLEHQQQELRQLIRYAVDRSPYYREALGPDAFDADSRLDELPTLPKRVLMEQWDRVVTDRRLCLEEVEAHLAGDTAGDLILGDYHGFVTSGTSGLRGVFVQTRAEFDVHVATCLRTMIRGGMSPATRLVGIGAPGPLHITRKLFVALAGPSPGSPQLTVTMPLPDLVGALNERRPEAVLTHATVAGLLAEEQLQGRLAIEPRYVIVSSEVLSEDVKNRIQAAWGIEPFEVYATTETVVLAAGSPERVGLHVSDDLLLLEVVDEQNRPVPAGQPGYKVLVTNLVNRALPLIRYELSDSVTLAAGPDPSGRPYTRIERVDGRDDDILKFPGLQGGTVAVYPHRLRAPFAALPDVLQYQILHGDARLRLRVTLRPAAAPDTTAVVRDALARAIMDAGAVPPAIEVERVSEIEREPGGGAKLKLVKSLP
jgi:phenylacetate-coenzyme A ligase PaaK-like adenylate-forming protein